MTTFWGGNASWVLDQSPTPHEARYLKLDATRAHTDLAWTSRLNLETALQWLVQWYKAHRAGADMQAFTFDQGTAYESVLQQNP
jgi:CDP-glucose 4,6-dehydratase